MSDAAIAPAEPRDREALLDLWVEAWTVAMPAIDFAARRAWFAQRLDDLAAEGATTLAARDGSGLSGFFTLDPRSGDLDQFVVRPALRGSGLASRLMKEAKRRSPEGLSLQVNQDNPRAVAFYRREGFVVVSAGANPRSGLPIWRMRWSSAPCAEG